VKNEKDFEGYVIVTFDLNNLKQCNDQYGHRVGDEYIINAAHIIEDNFERYGKCYRIGGDEFCVIMPDAKENSIEGAMDNV
jgi:diguanylate cyclase (GGDEF)-like protein